VTGVTGNHLSINCSVIQSREGDYPLRWKSINELEAQISLMLSYDVVLKEVIAKEAV
jgi:hypothetical protein